jgi:transposase
MARKQEQYPIDDEAREALESLKRGRKTPKNLFDRADMILRTAAGETVESVALALRTTIRAVYRWRKRFKEFGLEGLKDRPRSGQPPKATDKLVQTVLRLTVERVPREATHWSLRLMAKYAGTTRWQVEQIWKAADLRPHRLKTFKISNDPHFAEKVIDVVGLYLDPPDNAMVLSVDEKTQIQALDRTQPLLPLRPGQIERRTHDYKRNGTVSLYAAFDVATGQVRGRVTTRHRAKEFLDFLKQIDRGIDPGLAIHVILDNSSTHKTEAIQSWLSSHSRFIFHFTPTSASWLNAVESWFSQLERRSLYRGVFTSVKNLRDEIKRYIEAHNDTSAKPFKWTKNAETIIAATKRVHNLNDGTNQTEH